MSTGTALDVAVVGAGIGGLAAAVRLRQGGHRVTVVEQADRLAAVGAGIQVPPNATRVLQRLGVFEALRASAVSAQQSVRRRYADGAVLGSYALGDAVVERFGAPYVHAHRGDLHRVLLAAAVDGRRAGPVVSLRLGATVVGVDQPPAGPARAVTATGEAVPADVVVGADGIHSAVREAVGIPDRIRYSGDVAYRSLVPVRSLLPRPELAALTRPPSVTIWLGPGRHLVHYLVSGGELLNVVVIAPGDGDHAESWSAVGSLAEVRRAVAGWDPRAAGLATAAGAVHRTGLYDREPLADWTAGRVALLGDACHPMLPYQAQGAAQALEDAAALGDALDGVDPDGVAAALDSYAARRRPHAAAVQGAARHNRELFHLPDGPGQVARDARLAAGSGDFDAYAWIWSHELERSTP